MTKKELSEIIKDMPENAEVWMEMKYLDTTFQVPIKEIHYFKEDNSINLY